MNRLLLVISVVITALGLSHAAEAQAWSETLSWDAVATATSYKVEKSIDAGVTWTSAGTPTLPTLLYTGLTSETGLVLFRVSACNASGCTTRPTGGFWHFETAPRPPQPPGSPVNQKLN